MFTILGITRNIINNPSRCPYCGGQYVLKDYGIACLMCDRTPDALRELQTYQEQTTKRHTNTHQYRAGGAGAGLKLSKYRG
jgi:hypothetical protein